MVYSDIYLIVGDLDQSGLCGVCVAHVIDKPASGITARIVGGLDKIDCVRESAVLLNCHSCAYRSKVESCREILRRIVLFEHVCRQ